MQLTKKEQVIVDFIELSLCEFNGSIMWHETYMTQYRGEDFSAGYFESPDLNSRLKYPRIHVAIGNRKKKEWLGLLIHEFCHFKQWIAQTDKWIAGKDIESGEVIVDLEWECEKIAINLIKKFDLSDVIDIPTYIKMANAYLIFYQIYALTNKWYEISPFSCKAILDLMPSKLISKPFRYKISDKLMGIYIRKCYKKNG